MQERVTKVPKVFLTAEWNRLLMLNYDVDKQLLAPHVPRGCELDFCQDRCYISLVGFQFSNTRVKGCRFPFHVNFLEVNLRFYVRRLVDRQWRRGVVFIREIVPKRLITWVANGLYRENYITLPMRSFFTNRQDSVGAEYQWKYRGQWLTMRGRSPVDWDSAIEIAEGSEEEFFTEHYWGYTRKSIESTAEYEVRHPRWCMWPLEDFGFEGNVSDLYPGFSEILMQREPVSALLADGSPVEVFGGSACFGND
jgi:hypothetical protein